MFAWDKSDVYTLYPQSCGGDNCGSNYTGYYWRAMSVAKPLAFRWLAAGYGTDGVHVYNQWRDKHFAIVATPRLFQVLKCEDRDGGPVGFDGTHWYDDGRRLPPFPGE